MYPKQSKYLKNEKNFEGIVYKKKIYPDKITLYIKAKEKLIVNYYTKESLNILLGDKIKVTGELVKPSNNTIPNIFNYKKYLYNNNIFYIVKAKSIIKKDNNTNIIYFLREKINNRINNISNSIEYIKVFVLGDSSAIDEQTLLSFQKNGISHLFSISGMHISLFTCILMYLLKKISYSNFYNYFFVIIFLICYSLLVGTTPSVTRSLIMYILFSINKVFNLKIKSIDIMCQVLIIILTVNPYYIYNISFQYSYLISFFLVLFSYKLKKKSYLLKCLNISLISFLISFPICIYNFYQVNFFSIILNIILIPFVSIIIFPLSIICFVIPIISPLLEFFTNILQKISIIVSSNNFGTVIFSKPSITLIIIYYIFIILFLYNHKYMYIFLIMLIHKLSIYLNPSFEFTMLDVGQGDSMLIRYPYNQGSILVDTGGLANSNYSIAVKKTIPYLKSLGINKIDYLILTHGDFDHLGETNNLIDNFKINKIIFNKNKYNSLEKQIISHSNIPYQKNPQEIIINNNKIFFLNSSISNDENISSIVLYFIYGDFSFLLTGDIPKEIEALLIKQYKLSTISFLKVSHHGSRTGTSDALIKKIKPNYCLLSVGKNNIYHHPNTDVLSRLSSCSILRTDIVGSIVIKIKKNKVNIFTYGA